MTRTATKPKTSRKGRSDGVEAAVEAAKAAAKGPHKPPAFVRLGKQHMPFWEAIMSSRARAEWAEADLIVAAQLARCQYDIEKHSQLAEDEGPVIENAKGTPVMNPRQSALEQMARRQLAFMRTLTMGGSMAGHSKLSRQKARELERQARDARKDVEGEDDLLA